MVMGRKKEMEQNRQEEITLKGNPRKPQGEEGRQMLSRMNESHAFLTQWALGFFDFQESDHVLDIGCGGGAALARMASHIGSGHLTGIDYSKTSVEMSRELNAAALKSGKMDILEGSVEQLPFENGAFDKIVTVESFYFWPNPVENLREVRRVLKKGGVFLLAADIYQKEGLSKATLDNISRYALLNPTPEEFQRMFAQAGFPETIVHTEQGQDWICVEGRG